MWQQQTLFRFLGHKWQQERRLPDVGQQQKINVNNLFQLRVDTARTIHIKVEIVVTLGGFFLFSLCADYTCTTEFLLQSVGETFLAV